MTSLADKLASFGQLTSMILLVAPLPQFVFCHKKSLEKISAMQSVSYKYLLTNLLTRLVWVAYAAKIKNVDLLVIHAVGVIICFFFMVLYVYVKCKQGRSQGPLFLLWCSSPLIYSAFSRNLTADHTG